MYESKFKNFLYYEKLEFKHRLNEMSLRVSFNTSYHLRIFVNTDLSVDESGLSSKLVPLNSQACTWTIPKYILHVSISATQTHRNLFIV